MKSCLLLCALLAGIVCAEAKAQVPTLSDKDAAQVLSLPRQQLDAWLKSQIKAHGGDWPTQRYHFWIGLSTGHFGQDPVQAIAMRRMVFSLLNNSFAAGDKVTPFAWEMEVWNTGQTVTLTDAPETRREVVDNVPATPRSGSQGGHDIPRAFYNVLTQQQPKPADAQSCIVLLFTNTNVSQGPSGQNAALFGEDNPKLRDVVQGWGFHWPAVRQSFPIPATQRSRQVDVTALFPEALKSLPGFSPTPRRYFPVETWQPITDRPPESQNLPNRPDPGSSAGISKWGIGIIAILVVVAMLALLLRRGRTQSAGKAPTEIPAATPPPVQEAPLAPSSQERLPLPPLTFSGFTQPPPAPQEERIESREEAEAAPQPLPGVVKVRLQETEYVLTELHIRKRWAIRLTGTDTLTLEEREVPNTTEPTPTEDLATLFFDPDEVGILVLKTESAARIAEPMGSGYTLRGDELHLARAKHVICDLVVGAPPQNHFLDLQYQTPTS